MRATLRQITILAFLSGTISLTAQEPAASGPSAKSEADLAAAAQNPVAAMISLPLQNNMTFGVGPDDDIQNILNVQPVYPISVSSDWNLITRTVLPIVNQPMNINTQVFCNIEKPSTGGDWQWRLQVQWMFPK